MDPLRRWIALLALLCFCAPAAFAADAGGWPSWLRGVQRFIYLERVENPNGTEPLRAGSALLLGEVRYEGGPAEGLRLRLVLNGQYRSERVTVDARGRFALPVAPGEWRVSVVLLEGWPGHDLEKVVAITGEERDLGSGHYYKGWPDAAAPPVALAPPAGEPGFRLELRRALALTWPGGAEQAAEADRAAVEWEPYPGAARYMVSFDEVTRRSGGVTSHTPVRGVEVQAGTRLPLRDLPTAAAAGRRSYAVRVAAFDAAGRFLTETPELRQPGFVLDGRQLVPEDLWSAVAGEPPLPAAELDELLANDRRLETVEFLLDEELPQAAEQLFAKVQGRTAPGRRAAVEAYLRAAQGRCEEAAALAVQARRESVRCLARKRLEACPQAAGVAEKG